MTTQPSQKISRHNSAKIVYKRTADGDTREFSQQVSVTGGKKHSLRFHIALPNIPGGRNAPGAGRGYGSLLVWVHWTGLYYFSWFWTADYMGPSTKWRTISGTRFNNYDFPTPYSAPDKATAETLQFQFSTNVTDKLPSAFGDDVEFVER